MALIFFAVIGFHQPDIKLKLNENQLSLSGFKPIIVADSNISSVLVPADLIAEDMGATVKMNQNPSSLTIKKSADTLVFYPDKNTALVNGREKQMFTEAIRKDGHYYIPVRFLGENLGKSVFWEAKSSTYYFVDSIGTSIPADKDAKDYISINHFNVKYNKLYFKTDNENGLNAGYTLDEKLNPSINKQIHELIKVLTNKSYYLDTSYHSGSEANETESFPYVSVSLSATRADILQGSSMFRFTFYEKSPVNVRKMWKQKGLSTKAKIKLELNALIEPDDTSDDRIDEFYSNKLKLAFISLFNESTGLNICDFILGEYSNIMEADDDEYNDVKKTRTFDNVKVDFISGSTPEKGKGALTFYFTF